MENKVDNKMTALNEMELEKATGGGIIEVINAFLNDMRK